MTRRTWLLIAAALTLALAIVGLGGAANTYVAARPADSLAANVAASNPTDKENPTQADCAQIAALGIDKQMNLHAGQIMISCGQAQGGTAGAADAGTNGSKAIRPNVYGGTDVNVILPDSTYPKVTQSETFIWGAGNTIVTTYNDSRRSASSPVCYGGGSVSTNGGATFARINETSLCGTSQAQYGDPTVVYDAARSKWVVSWLDAACGGQGIGIWTSPDGVAWTRTTCARNTSQGDRQSSWADRNPVSPYYGRVYISFNDFNVAGPPIQVMYSNDGGSTWSAPVTLPLPPGAAFARDVQITGSQNGDGTVFIATMNEGGGGLATRTNYMYRSTDGGATWPAPVQVGAPFQGPGEGASGYFATMFGSTYWRYMGWGKPDVAGRVGGQNVVQYIWTQCGTNVVCSGSPDKADIYYSRSLDNGATWAAAIKMNTDAGTAKNWQPSISASPNGTVFASWYDTRNGTASCTPGSSTPCYERYGRSSTDNGATWQPDMPLSDVVSPLPAQPDSGVQATYAGDYDYVSSEGNNHYHTWVDGRVLINNTSQQDVFFDKVVLIQGTPTPTVTGTPPSATPTRTFTLTPTATATICGGSANYSIATATGATVVPATTFVAGSNCDDCSSTIALPFPFRLYDQTFNTANVVSNGNVQFLSSDASFSNTCLPYTAANYAIVPHWDDLLLTGANQGIYTNVSGSAPNRIFDIEWRGGYFSGGGTVDFEVRLYENSPTGQFDIIYGTVTQTGTSATIGVQKDNGSVFTQFSCNTASLSAGLKLTFTQPPCGTAGPTFTQGPATGTPTRTVTPNGTASATPTCNPNGGTPGPWNTASPVPYAIVRYAFAQNGNNFYIMGGVTTGGTITNNVSRYDATTGVWTALAPVPGTAGEAPSAAYFNNKIYYGGGGNLTGFYIYDITAGTWTTGASMPLGTYGAAAGAFNGKVYFAGGTSNSGPSTNLQVYDIAGNSWSVGTPVPGVGFFLGGYQQAGQYLYLVGNYGAAPQANGFSASSVFNRSAKLLAPDANGTETRRLDMTTAPGVWTLGPTWTAARADMGVAYSGGKLYALAGDTTGGGYFNSTNLVDELDVSAWPAGTWVASPPLLPGQPRQANQAGFTSTDGRIWSVGGIDGTTFTFLADVYNRSGGSVPCGTAGPTVTQPPQATPTRTTQAGNSPTPGATATCAPSAGGWTTGADSPTVQVRAAGVYFPANGKFYAMGGRSSDTAGSDLLNPREYNPATNTWVTKAAAYNDSQVNNQACGVLTVGGTPYIYCVGGSAAGATTASAQVRRYDPVADVLTVVAGDNWPGNATGDTLPGGFTVANNKLYILGGFQISIASTNQIWEYDPNAGTHWTQKVNAPTNLMYAPTTTIGGIIYVGGASDFDGTTVIDTTTSFSFNPVANTIGTIATIPRATGETRAVAVNGKMWVLGGGRVAPNPSNEVDVYNPGTNSWSLGPAFVTARRNFFADTNGAGKIVISGGYAPTTGTANTEVYNAPTVCGTATTTPIVTVVATVTVPIASATRTTGPGTTPSATVPVIASATRTTGPGTTPSATAGVGTATATTTVCPVQFQDVANTDPFYVYIRCLACRGIISGYTCGGVGEPCVPPGNKPYFRTGNLITRGQVSKMVSLAAGLNAPVPSGQQTFEDVPSSNPFWPYIERLATAGYISGYACGGVGEPCQPPANRPYFRPFASITRGQLAKIDTNAAGYTDIIPSTQQTFEDVPFANPFWLYIERAAIHGVISGYNCGGVGEPCNPPGNRPYFRTFASTTRGQASKIVANTFFPGCNTPARPAQPSGAPNQ